MTHACYWSIWYLQKEKVSFLYEPCYHTNEKNVYKELTHMIIFKNVAQKIEYEVLEAASKSCINCL